MSASHQGNRLSAETSPYLLQHAHNPVDWYPWGREALERARATDRPILLSIGYSACHWCHVMERECFENEAIAAQMNRDFVCIKVDREERPDLDEIYMAATVALSGSGGWPMTVFLTPDQRPFFAGTYFPPRDAYGRPGFPTLLRRIAELWRNDRQALFSRAEELTAYVREQSALPRTAPLCAGALDRAVGELERVFDPRFGGFGAAPKFPPCGALQLVLRKYAQSREPRLLELLRTTLDGMKNGGLYDQLGGGFARYSTDERWLVPHFEKMLYDNAELARVYLAAYQLTKDPEYRRVASETLDWVIREMQEPGGGYHSAVDADSDGEEGKYYVWSRAEIGALLDQRTAERFAAYYDVSEQGNWEGKNILHVDRCDPAVAASLAAARRTLLEARGKRVPPLIDDKILTSWNALMIGAMAEGFRVLRDRRYLSSAERAARALRERLTRPDGGLYRTARGRTAHVAAYLEDYAHLADAEIDLYEACGDAGALARAEALVERMLRDFGDPEAGAFYFTAHDHETLIARPRSGHDGALPNPNAVAARALSRLAVHLGREDFRERALGALAAYGALVDHAPRAFSSSIRAAEFLIEPPLELVLADDEAGTMASAVAEVYLPNRVIGYAGAKISPLCAGKSAPAGRVALWICRDYTCLAPVTEATAVADALAEAMDRHRVERRPSAVALSLGRTDPAARTPRRGSTS